MLGAPEYIRAQHELVGLGEKMQDACAAGAYLQADSSQIADNSNGNDRFDRAPMTAAATDSH